MKTKNFQQYLEKRLTQQEIYVIKAQAWLEFLRIRKVFGQKTNRLLGGRD